MIMKRFLDSNKVMTKTLKWSNHRINKTKEKNSFIKQH